MKKLITPLTAEETLERISKQWASKRDVMDIGFVGDTKAGIVVKEIKGNLEHQGYKLPSNYIPMQSVIYYFKINVSYLKKVSQTKKDKKECMNENKNN